LLAGSVTGRLSQGLQNTLGLSQVRLEPNLISPESDPSARLTIGQDITSSLELIYSMNLADSGDQIFVVDYDLTRRFNGRATKQADNTYRFDFQHDLRFGGPRPQASGRVIGWRSSTRTKATWRRRSGCAAKRETGKSISR
jgi:hypothetical protein